MRKLTRARGVCESRRVARFEHRVRVPAVQRRWFDALVAALFDGIADRRVRGRFVHPDYRIETDVWERTGVASGVLSSPSPNGGDPVSFELLSPSSPRTASASSVHGDSSWTATADLRAWRSEATIRHAPFSAEVLVAVADPAAPDWALVVTAEVTGKSWGRWLLLLGRRWLQQQFAGTVNNAAASWEAQAAALLQRDPADVAAELLDPRHRLL